MQTETINSAENGTDHVRPDMESVYRTKWLMAHNWLHKVAHAHPALLKQEWDQYLDELSSAEDVAAKAA
jgi:hypothetical protein